MAKVLLHELGQSVSFGRLSLLGKVLWPMLLAASDDQGRGQAEADVIKWTVCPNVQELTAENIPDILQEMADQNELMIHLYKDSRGRPLYQIVRWWEYQRMQWAQPSHYEAPEGWADRVRANRRGKEFLQENWGGNGGFDGFEGPEEGTDDTLPGENAGENPGGNAGETPGGDITKLNLSSTKPNSTRQEDAPEAPETPILQTFADWQSMVKESSNRPAALRVMFSTLYPKSDTPDFGYLGRVAKNVGGAGRLAELLWQHCTRPPTGDVLAYIQGVVKRQKERNATRQRNSRIIDKPPAQSVDAAQVERDRAALRAHRAQRDATDA